MPLIVNTTIQLLQRLNLRLTINIAIPIVQNMRTLLQQKRRIEKKRFVA
jgi:hypothetical protein